MRILDDFLENMTGWETFVTLGIGALLILFGYRIKKAAFFIIWFLIGYALMNGFLMGIINNNVPEIAENDLWQTLLPVGGGLLLALLGFSIEKICVGGICFALVLLITSQYFGTDIQTLAIGAIIGIAASGLATMLMKPATIVATSVAGAYALTMAMLKLSGIDSGTYYFPILIGGTLVGCIVQFLTTKNMK